MKKYYWKKNINKINYVVKESNECVIECNHYPSILKEWHEQVKWNSHPNRQMSETKNAKVLNKWRFITLCNIKSCVCTLSYSSEVLFHLFTESHMKHWERFFCSLPSFVFRWERERHTHTRRGRRLRHTREFVEKRKVHLLSKGMSDRNTLSLWLD